MPTTAYKGYSVPTPGTESGTWGADINANSFAVIDTNLGGIVTKTLSNVNVILSAPESQNLILRLTGTLTGAVQVTTAALGFTIVENSTTGPFNVTFTNGIGTPVFIPGGHRALVITDAVNGPRVLSTSQIDDLLTAGLVRRQSSGYLITDPCVASAQFQRDNGGAALSTGIQGDIIIPFAGTITGVTLLANVSGSMVVDLWKAPYASFPPTVANTIVSATPPTLTAALKYQDTTLTGWTTAVAANDVIRVNINSVATISRFVVALSIARYT
jgi:hypothetical protein